jgi:hypothetical protein
MPTWYWCRGKHNAMLFTQDSGFLRVSGWQKFGVLVSIVWMIGLPICVMIDSNRRASEFYNMCRKVESNLASAMTTEQQHEACWRSAKFITPTVLAQTLIAGNADTATLWFFMLGPVVIFWAIGSIILATVRRLRRSL